MEFVWGLLLGVVVGAVVIYWALSRQITAQKGALQALRRQLTQADVERDRRIKVATESLQQSHAAQLAETHAKTEAIQQKLTTTKAERDRLRYDYDTHMRAAHADAARQVQQKLAEAEADYNQRLQPERDRLQQAYAERLAATQPYTTQPLAPLASDLPTAESAEFDLTEPIALALSDTPPEATLYTETLTADQTSTESWVPHTAAISIPTETNLSSDSVPVEAPPSSLSPTVAVPESKMAAIDSQQSTVLGSKPTKTASPQPANTLNQNASVLMSDSYAANATVRCQVARVIADAMPAANTAVQTRWLPTLKRLARDRNPKVRLQAIRAMGQMKKVAHSLPALRQALRDSDPAVVKAASAAMTRFKSHS